MERPELKGRFVFVPGAGRELLKAKAKGGDICVNTPLQGKEACGTSDQRTNLNFDSITVSVDTGGPHDYIQDGENGLLIGPYASDEEFLRNAPWDLLDKLTIASEMYYARQESADTRWDEMAERAHRVANEVVTDEAMAKRYVNAVYLPVLREKGIIAMEDDVKRAASLEEAALVAI
jgi:glucan phosphorylase